MREEIIVGGRVEEARRGRKENVWGVFGLRFSRSIVFD